MKKLITMIILTLGTTTALADMEGSLCSKVAGVELILDSQQVIRGDGLSLIEVLSSDKDARVRGFLAALKAGKGCPPTHCVSKIVVLKKSAAGDVVDMKYKCRAKMNMAGGK